MERASHGPHGAAKGGLDERPGRVGNVERPELGRVSGRHDAAKHVDQGADRIQRVAVACRGKNARVGRCFLKQHPCQGNRRKRPQIAQVVQIVSSARSKTTENNHLSKDRGGGMPDASRRHQGTRGNNANPREGLHVTHICSGHEFGFPQVLQEIFGIVLPAQHVELDTDERSGVKASGIGHGCRRAELQ